jgi:peptidase E
MLAIWRTHGVDIAFRQAWESGTVMAGVSAGAICWFEQGSTDSFGPGLAAMDCLGWLPGSFCPHYDGEAWRRPRLHQMVAAGDLTPGLAADDGCAVL